jgi:hypothetical protein
MKSKKRPLNFEFDVALTFAGEDRPYVREVAKILRKMGLKVFYDEFSKGRLWGQDLYVFLDDIYRNKARYTVMFISKKYASNLWTNYERKSAQARAFEENKEYILPARFDSTEIPGISPTLGYVDLKNINSAKLARLIKEKVGPVARSLFLPEEIDLLYKKLNVKKDVDKRVISFFSSDFFDNLKLMTEKERSLIGNIIIEACVEGEPRNFHVVLEALERTTGYSSSEILATLSRLSVLGFDIKTYPSKHLKHAHELRANTTTVELKFTPLALLKVGNKEVDMSNGTFIVWGIRDCLNEAYCRDHFVDAFRRLDLSALSSYAIDTYGKRI